MAQKLKLETKPKIGGEASGIPPRYTIGSGLHNEVVLGIDIGSRFMRIAWISDDQLTIPKYDLTATTAVTRQGKLKVNPGEADLEALPNINSPRNFIGTNYEMYTEYGSFNASLVMATILYWIKLYGEHYLERPVSKAVLTVPIDYTSSQRQLIKDLAKAEGIEVLQLINEPSAVALNFFAEDKMDGDYLFIHCGHSSLGVMALTYRNGIIEIKATSGDKIGAEDMDQLLVDYLIQECQTKHKITFRQDEKTIRRFAAAAENIRKELSSRVSVPINIPRLTLAKGGVLDLVSREFNLSTEISREQYEKLIAPLMEKINKHIATVMSEAAFDSQASSFIGIVASGAMTYYRPFIDALKASSTRVITEESSGAAACGAARLAQLIMHNDRSMVVWDALSLPVSICSPLDPERLLSVIAPNTPLPINVFKKVRCYAGTSMIDVYQGRGNKKNTLSLQGTIIINNIPPTVTPISPDTNCSNLFMEEVELEIGFHLSQDGQISYSAKHPALDIMLPVHFARAQNSIDKSCIDEIEELRLLSEQMESRRLDRLARKLNIDRDHVFETLRQQGYSNKQIGSGRAVEEMLYRLRKERIRKVS